MLSNLIFAAAKGCSPLAWDYVTQNGGYWVEYEQASFADVFLRKLSGTDRRYGDIAAIVQS